MSRPVSKNRRQRVAASPAAAGFRPASAALAVAAAFTMPNLVLAQPTGASVVQGQATFARSGSNLVVTTTNAAGTNQSAINWQSFSVPTGSTTQFNQPTTTSTSVNRVLGSDPSSIFGTLSSNGRLVLVNPNGIAVGKGAVVDTAAFTASTLKMSDADVAAGRMAFGGNAGGLLQVDGHVIARQGDVLLIAPNVQTGQSALVQAPNGSTVLAAGQKVEVTGRGLEGIHFEVQAGNQAVNLGTLQGNAVGIFAGTLKHSGAIAATAVTSEGGKVVLKAAGDNIVSGSIRATALGDKGGSIDVLGERVGLMAGAVVDASGANGGGQVRIGGDYQGKNADVQNALRTYVDALATVRADATKQGDGGRVIVWSDEATRMHGKISARGGAEGGNGGFVEVSGKQYLEFTGLVDLRAPQGDAGNLLLDPNDIQIAAAPATTDTTTDHTSGPPYVFAGGGPVSTIQDSTLSGQLALGNVEVRTDMGTSSGPQGGQISLLSGANVSWVAPTALWLRADAGIDLQGTINGSHPSSTVHLSAQGGSVVQTVGGITAGYVLANAVGSVQLLGSNSITNIAGTAGTDFQLANGSTPITVSNITTPWGNSDGITALGVNLTTMSDINLQAPISAAGYNVFLNSNSGNISQTSGVITASGVLVDAGGALSLPGANMIDTVSGWSNGGFEVTNAKALTIGGVSVPFTGGNHGASGSGISATGIVHVSTTVGDLNTTNSVYGSSITLAASGGGANLTVDQSTSASNGELLLTATNDVTLGSSGSLSANNGPVTMTAGHDVLINGYVMASGGSLDITGGNNVTISGYPSLAGDGVKLTATAGNADLGGAYISSITQPITVSALAGGILGSAYVSVSSASGGSIQMSSGTGGVSFGSFSATNGGSVTVNTSGGVNGYSISAYGKTATATTSASGGGLVSITAGNLPVSISYISAGGGYGSSGTGGAGGTVSVSAGGGSTVSIGNVSAAGADGGAGGGAGGTISIAGGTMTGNSILSANGGNAYYSGVGGTGGSVTVNAGSMTLGDVHVKGGDGASAGGTGGLISLGASGGSIDVTVLSAVGGWSSAGTGGGGGTIITSSGSLTVDQIYAYAGGSGPGAPGLTGGTVSINASGGGQAVTVNGIDVNGTAGTGTGGPGGVVIIDTSGGGMAIGSILANGGASSGISGDGGSVTLSGQGLIQVGHIDAYGGSSFSYGSGGLGGAVKITSTAGDITITEWIDASGGPGATGGRAKNFTDDGKHAIELNAPNGTVAFPSIYANGGYSDFGDGAKGGSVAIDAKNMTSGGDFYGYSIYTDGGDGNTSAGQGGSMLLTGGSGGGTFNVGRLSAIGGFYGGSLGAPGGKLSINAPTTSVTMPAPDLYSPGSGGVYGMWDVTAQSLTLQEPADYHLWIENATLATSSGNLNLEAFNGGSIVIRNSTLSTASGAINAQAGSGGTPTTFANALQIDNSTIDAGGGNAMLVGYAANFGYGATITGNVQLSGNVFIGGNALPASASYGQGAGGILINAATITGGGGTLVMNGSADCGCAVILSNSTINRTGGDVVFAANGVAGPNGNVEISDTNATFGGGNVSMLSYGGGWVTMTNSSFGTGGGAVVATSQGGIELLTSTIDTAGGAITLTGGTLSSTDPGVALLGGSSVHGGTGLVKIDAFSGSAVPFVLTSASPPAATVSGADVVITGSSATPGGIAVLISGETVTATNSMSIIATGGELRVENSSTITNSGPGPMQLISQYATPAPPPPVPATSLNVTAGSSISSTGTGDVLLVSDTLDVSGTLSAAGRVVIAPTTSTLPISYGGAPDPSKFVLSASTLANISAGSVVVGSGTTTGGLSIDGNIGGPGQTISLINAGAITQAGGTTITAQNLNVDGGSVLLPKVDVSGTLSGRAQAGSYKVQNQSASSLLTIGTVDGVNGIIATGGDVAVATGNGLALSQPVISDASGTAVVLSATTLNNTSTINATNGRWLIYLSDVTGNSFGGLASGNLALWNRPFLTNPPSGVTETGNRYLFAAQPTVNVTADPVTKVYDGTTTLPTLTFTTTGLVDAASFGNVFLQDTFTGTLAVPTITKNVGSYPITQGTLTQPTGYAMGTFTSASASITPLAIGLSGTTITSKVYDGTTAAAVASPGTLTGVIGGDAVSATGGSGLFIDKNVGTNKTVTVSGFSLTGADAGNYTIGTIAPTTGTITPKSVTLSGTAANSRAYDATTNATLATVGTLAGTIGGDSVTVGSTTANFADKNVGTSKPVTVNATLAGADAANYSFFAPTGITANITPFALGVTGLTASNKVYNANTTATITGSVSLTGVFAGDSVSGSGGTSGVFFDKNVGTGKAVSVSTITLSGTDATNYTVVTPTLSANITPASLGVTGLSGVSRTYDGTVNATVTGTPSLSGAFAGDSITVGGGTVGTFADKNAGTAKPVTVTDLVLGGTDVGNYLLLPTTVTANITPASLTVSGVSAVSRVYNGTTLASLSGSAVLGGVIAGDSVTASGGTGTFANKNVGTAKPVTVTGMTLAGTDAGNYTVIQPTGLDANITPATLTVSGITAANKVYDATTSATLGGTPTLSGVVAGDSVSVSGGSGAFVDKNVGTGKTVTVSGLALGGTDALNYSLTAPTGVTANITPASLTASGLTAQNKVYDGTTLATLSGSATLTGVIGSDNVTVSGGSGKFADKNVGTAKTVTITGATLGGTDAGNYTLTASGTTTADITKKALSVTGLTASNKVYDATTTATLNGTAALAGVIAGDAVTVSGGTGAFNNKNVGSAKPVLVSGLALGGTDAGNYSVTAPSSLIADITPATVTVSGLTAQNKVYDGTTVASLSGSATLSGVMPGDSVSATGAVGAFANKNVGSAKPVTVSGATLVGADAGNYTVTTPSALVADITPATLTLSGLGAASKVYDGTTNATLSGSAGLTGLVPGDAVSITGGSGQFSDKNVGNAKPVAVTGVTVGGADAPNYKLVVPSQLTASISPATLTVPGLVANDKTYDSTVGATLGGSTALTGVVTGDVVSVASTSATFNNKNVGTGKPVTVNAITLGGADSGNYTVSLPAGLLASITPKELTAGGVTALDKVYDANSGATLTGTLTLTGVFPGDVVSGTPGLATFADRNAATNKPVTVFSVDLAGSDAGNYIVVPPSGLHASITPAPLTIRANDQAKTEGTAFTFTGTEFAVNGLIGVERVNTVTLTSTGAPAPATSGDYPITASAPVGTAGFLASNYTTTFQNGTMRVSATPVAPTPPAPAPAQQQVQNLVVSFAQLFVEEAKVQPPADGGSNNSKDKDGKKAGKDDVVITDTSCK